MQQELIKSENVLSLEEQFEPFQRQAKEWMEKAQTIQVTDVGQTELMASAREARLALRGIRIGVDRKHKELKEESLRYSQSLDKIKRMLVGMIEPIEAHLEEQEKFAEVQEAKARKELASRRATELSLYMTFEEAVKFPLAEMGEDAFSNMMEGYRTARDRKLKEEEDARLEQERNAKESARLAKENEKLNKKLESERTERKRLENQAEVIRQKEEQRKKDEANAKRREQRAPDKEKVAIIIRKLYALAGEMPQMTSEEGEAIVADAKVMIGKMIDYLNKKSDQL